MAAIIQQFLSWGNSNEYLLAKFGVDTAENEPLLYEVRVVKL